MARRGHNGRPKWKQYTDHVALKSPNKESHCLSKSPLSIQDAQRIIKRAKIEGRHLSWYECEYCHKAHLTSG